MCGEAAQLCCSQYTRGILPCNSCTAKSCGKVARMFPAIVLSSLSIFIIWSKFHINTVASVIASHQEREFDVLYRPQGYVHSFLSIRNGNHIWFALKGVVYQFKSLGFSLLTSPQVFMRVIMNVISTWTH